MDPSCVFCKLINEQEYDNTELGVAWLTPLNPVTPGHKIFMPVLHVANAATAPHITSATFHVASWYAGQIPSAFNLITSSGGEATQTVNHLHVHYVPRTEGDGLHLPWTP